MAARGRSPVNTSNSPVSVSWERSSAAPLVRMRKPRLSRPVSLVQGQIPGKGVNPGLSDKALPLHLFPWVPLARHRRLRPPYGMALHRHSLFMSSPGKSYYIWKLREGAARLCVSPFKTHLPNVVPKWNTSCQIFLDILTTRAAEGSKAKSSTGGEKSFL